MKIYAINFNDQFHECDNEALMDFVGSEKKEKLKRFRFMEDRVRGLYADLLIRYILIKEHGFSNEEIQFGKNKYGKPHLDCGSDIHFNYSHSGNWIACAVDQSPIGIDVEEVNDIDFAISERFFSEGEVQYLNAKKEDAKKECFFDFWTLKESYIKAIGMGLSKGLGSFTIQIDEEQGTIECDGWKFRQYDAGDDYKFSVCAEHEGFPGGVEMVLAEDVGSFFKTE